MPITPFVGEQNSVQSAQPLRKKQGQQWTGTQQQDQPPPDEFKVGSQLSCFKVTVNVGSGETSNNFEEINVNRGDDPRDLAYNFCKQHDLTIGLEHNLYAQIKENMETLFGSPVFGTKVTDKLDH